MGNYFEEGRYSWYDEDSYGPSSSELDESDQSQRSYGDRSTRTDSRYGNGIRVPVEQESDRPTVPEHYCRRCNRSFQQAQHLHQHWRASSLHPYYCVICKVDFDRQTEFEVSLTFLFLHFCVFAFLHFAFCISVFTIEIDLIPLLAIISSVSRRYIMQSIIMTTMIEAFSTTTNMHKYRPQLGVEHKGVGERTLGGQPAWQMP